MSKITEKTALDRFIELTIENINMIEKLTNYIGNHMDTNPDEINWCNVGDAGHVNEELKDIVTFLGLK